jgi:hypothetical protein
LELLSQVEEGGGILFALVSFFTLTGGWVSILEFFIRFFSILTGFLTFRKPVANYTG